MTTLLESSVVRIYSNKGKVIGAGFLVSPKRILTCAHVVASSLGIDSTTSSIPEAEISLDFPGVVPGKMFTAKVVFWRPVHPNPSTQAEFQEDIAALELSIPLPEAVRPVQLVTSEDLWGHPFRVLGFPDGKQNGAWASGELRAPIASGWVQLEDVKEPGYRLEEGFSGAPVWDEKLQAVVGMAVAAEKKRIEAKAAFIIPTSLLVKAWHELSEQAIPSCPYRGLFAFQEEDAPFFCGRETFTEQLLVAVQKKPLVAVIGASGSGKSSVVFAGLIPRLQQVGAQGGLAPLHIASFRPGDRPLHALASAIIPLLEPQLSKTDQLRQTRQLATDLRQDVGALRDAVEEIVKGNTSARLLLVADQFEELYTLCQDVEERQVFLTRLLEAVKQTGNFNLVLTLRADFLGYALSYRPLNDALQNADVKLGPMNRQELQDAVQKPAEKQGVKLEQGLTERILKAVGEEPGNLPLLEFALTQLWEKQSNGKLTHAAYDAIGGVEKALSNHADDVYAQLTDEKQKQVQKIFIQLVRPGEGTADTRRQATHAEVGEENWDLVKRLADERLVVTDRKKTAGEAEEETVEIVHEALIREWQRLRKWMKEDRAFRLWQERLRTAMRQWETTDKDDGALLRGSLLSEAEAWQQQRLAELSKEERVFIQLSLALRDREKNERIRLRQHITIGLVIGLSITTVLGLYTAWRWRLAEERLHQVATEQEQKNLAEQIAQVSLVPGTESFAVKKLALTRDAVWMTLFKRKVQEEQEDKGKGLMRYDLKGSPSETYLAENSVTALLVEEKDIWVGVSKDGTQQYLRHGSFQYGRWRFANELVDAPDYVSSLVRDRQNRLWAGTYSGLCLQKSQQCQLIEEVQSLCSTPKELQVYQISLDKQRDLLWIAMAEGLIRWDLNAKTESSKCYWYNKNQSSQEALFSGLLKTVTLDNRGLLWVSSNSGEVNRFIRGIDTPAWMDDVWKTYHPTSKEVKAVAALPKGFFLAGTKQDGLFLYSPTRDTWIKVPLDLKKLQIVYDIALGSDNHLWLATKEGLYRSVEDIRIPENQ